ncbi:MAG TPA: asparagine synthase-related protein [Vicinamibacteria bacterium]|nr:asparagine synthase-related protein [Vicinamibacteria bacterium]
MCGIVGMFGDEHPDTLKRMLDATSHRGEDSTRYEFWDGRCGLGINRLSIMDLERGEQPIHDESHDVQVVCNGEIYNHSALVGDLRDRHDFCTRSDVEVIAHLYEDHGADCVNFLDGMFAFLVYDRRRKTFLAARDPLGIKPFYYARDGHRWYFASEAKGILETGVDPAWIRMLPPGFRLTPERGPEQYFYLATHKSIPNPGMVRELLAHAVEKRMMADVEVGTFLSGGVDSSLVTAITAGLKPDVKAFTVGVEGAPDVEAAKIVSRHLGIRHYVRAFEVDELVDLLGETIWHVESYNPSMVTGSVVTLMAAKLAKEEGVKVVLCGEGSDEIFGGYLALRELEFQDLHDASWRLIENLHKTELQRLDRMSMAVSLEARVPFLDRDLVEYALNLPASAKIKNVDGRKIEKWILREAFDGIIPSEILWREKLPFDQGSGARALIAYAESQVSDDELREARERWPDAGIVSKEMLFYYNIWREHFGEMGGHRRFDLFGDYPGMMDRIETRTATSGS